MSGGPPPVVVDHSAAWAQVSVGDDIAAWAPLAAGRMWSLSGRPYSALELRLLAAKLHIMASSAFVVPCFGAFVFCPEPVRGPRAVFRLSGLRYPAGTEDQQIVDDILLPAEQQLVPPEVRHVDAPGLRRFRVRQRAWTESSGAVSDYLGYVYPFEEGAWLLSTALPDPREAERWLPDLDELVAGLRLQGAP